MTPVAGVPNPYRERAAGLLMTALARLGRVRAALDVYEQIRRMLTDDLGLEPGTELRELRHAILERHERVDEPLFAGDAARRSPPVVTTVGRDGLLATVCDALGARPGPAERLDRAVEPAPHARRGVLRHLIVARRRVRHRARRPVRRPDRAPAAVAASHRMASTVHAVCMLGW